MKISLPRGKTLYLGPMGRGQVHDDALERPAFKKLLEAGEIELLEGADAPSQVSDGSSARLRRSSQGHRANKGVARKGDR